MFPSPKWIQKRRRWTRIPEADPVGSVAGVLAPSELERAFQRERARVDRNDNCFSIVVFRVEPRGDHDVVRVAEALVERARAYDAVGVVDGRTLAVLLPETGGDGAWVFADSAVTQFASLDLAVSCEVYTYPHIREEGDDGEDTGGHGHPPHPGDDGPFGGPSTGRRTGTDGSVVGGTRPLESSEGHAAPTKARLRAVQPKPVLDPESMKKGRPVKDLAPLFEESLPLTRRVLDVAVSGTAILLLSPLLLVTAMAVKATSPGPVIFAQWRAGRGGRPFRFYKFRSMYRDAEERKGDLRLVNEKDGPIFKIKNDPRITPVGRIIRKLSIDELPQLFNVLKGDMTLVGPRPPVLDEVDGYASWQRQRLDITGGLTCIWQVSGRSEVSFEDWMRMDIRYKRKRSLRLDIKLLLKTIGAVFSGRGAY